MEETALVGLPAVSPAESPSAANKRKRKNPSPGKIETEEDLGQDEMEQDDNDSGHMGFEDDDDDEDDLSDSGEYDDKEDEENDLDDQIEDEEHQEMEHKEPHNPHIPNTAHIQHINLTGHTPTEGMPHPVAMVAVTQPNLVIPVKVGTLPSPQGTAQPPIRMTLSTQIQHPLTTATNQFIIKRGPGRPPGPGRPRGRPKGSVNSPVSFGERKSPGPGRPRIHPPKENQQKRPRGRPRIHPPKEPGEKKPRGRPISNPKTPSFPEYLAIVQTNGELQKRIKELESELGVMDDENAKLRKQLMELGVDTGSITRPPANLSFSPKDFKLRVVLHHPSPTKRSPCTTEEGETVEKKRPGRPRIHPLPDQNTPKKKRGRPRIHPITPKIPKKRGRPPKSSYIPKSECDTESVATTPVKVMDSAEEKELPNVIIKEGHYNGSPNSPPKPLTPLTPTQNGNNQTNGTPQVEYQQ